MKLLFAPATRDSARLADVLVVAVFEHTDPAAGLPSPLAESVRACAKTLRFSGHETALAAWPLSGSKPGYIILAGLGRADTEVTSGFRLAGTCVARHLRGLPFRTIHVQWPDTVETAGAVEAWVAGFHRGLYRMRTNREAKASSTSTWRVSLAAGRATLARKSIEAGIALGEAFLRTADLANRGGNQCTTDTVREAAQRLARESTGLRCSVWDARRLARERCRAHLGVGQGSPHAPCLIRIDHRPRGAKGRPIVLVGKTITFDSGGLSIKPSKSMETMKYDKSGGMTVLAVMDALDRLRYPKPVTGFLAVAENMPDGHAQRPGDIVETRRGLTVEVLNTDAEGRLVLADALDVACELKPAALIDLATLTGAAVTALGKERSAIIGTDRELVRSLIAAGERVGEKLWELPRDTAYRALLRSPAADLRNIGDGTAGTIVGGVFLEHFVDPSIPWAHIDLTHAHEDRERPHAPAGATLFGLHLLLDWMRRSS